MKKIIQLAFKNSLFTLLAVQVCTFQARAAEGPQTAPSTSQNEAAKILPPEKYQRDPEVVMNTKSLADLPKDLLSIPLLGTVLTEDFVTYYRYGGESWNLFKGTLLRLAFESEVDFPTVLLKALLNMPAEVALWKGPEGRLNHFMIVLDDSLFKSFALQMSKLSGKGLQLIETEKLAPTYLLEIANQQKVYITSDEGRLVLFSDLGMRLPVAGMRRSYWERVKALFGSNAEVGVFSPPLKNEKHAIQVSTKTLSFGYQELLPTVRGVLFKFSGDKEAASAGSPWSSVMLVDSAVKDPLWNSEKLFSTQARSAALCLAAPIDLQRLQKITGPQLLFTKAQNLGSICWYADSKFYTPILSLTGDFSESIKNTQQTQKFFADNVGNREALWAPRVDENAEPQLRYLPMLPVKVARSTNQELSLTRDVGGRYGLYATEKHSEKDLLGSKKYFRIKFSVLKDRLLFSPDDKLVDRALLVADGKFPSMTSTAGFNKSNLNQHTILMMNPPEMAKLLKSSILESLPASQEAIFRTAVSRQLFPNLDKAGKSAPIMAGFLHAGLMEKRPHPGTTVLGQEVLWSFLKEAP